MRTLRIRMFKYQLMNNKHYRGTLEVRGLNDVIEGVMQRGYERGWVYSRRFKYSIFFNRRRISFVTDSWVEGILIIVGSSFCLLNVKCILYFSSIL